VVEVAMIPISNRARPRGLLYVFDLPDVVTIGHVLDIPSGMCPMSGNPLRGTIELEYAAPVAVEVVSLHQLVQQAQHESPKTFEGWCAYVANAVASAVRVPVRYSATAQVNPGPQTLRVSSCASI